MFRRFRVEVLAHFGPVIVNHTAPPVVEHDTRAFDIKVVTARAVGSPDMRFAVNDKPVTVIEHDDALVKIEISTSILYRSIFKFDQRNAGCEYRLPILQGNSETFTTLTAAFKTVMEFHYQSLVVFSRYFGYRTFSSVRTTE